MNRHRFLFLDSVLLGIETNYYMIINTSPKQFPYLATVVAFVAIVIMAGLGFWQLDRKADKDIRLANIEKANDSAHIDLAKALGNIQSYQDFTVVASGRAQNKYFYIDNKLLGGRAGFHVLVPFEADQGTLMINLGWIPGTGMRGSLPEFIMPRLTTVEGVVHIPLKNTFIKETNIAYGKFPVLLQQVDLQEISLHLGTSVLPVTLRLLPHGTDFVRQWQTVIMSPQKHLGYAVQWFGLAIAALTVYLLSMLKRMQGSSSRAENE
ncbi:SURF1 family protein [Glaciecola punicea]|uniref:SURF1 family protein n=1 Tax=Glaciecola punicea TaxID=56804 RepID=UPI0009F386F1|nr:SURF1 family protein [Glaciecola punicea]